MKFLALLLLFLKCTKIKNVFMADKELKIFESKAKAAYNKATPEGRDMLEQLLGKENLSVKITDRIKTIRDCVEACGKDYDVEFAYERTKWMTPDEVAYKEMKFIAQALNDGVVLDFENSYQHKYYPFFTFSGRGLSLRVVNCVGGGADVAPCLCMVSEEMVRYAVSQFHKTYETYYKNNK